MNKVKKIMSIITSCVIMMASTSVNYSNAVTEVSGKNESKISEELLKIIETTDDSKLIPVGIKIKDLDWSIIDNMIEKNSKFKVSDYCDMETYSNGIMLDIIKTTEEKYGFEKSHITPLKNPKTGKITYTSDIYFDSKSDNGKLLSEMNYEKRTDYILSKVSDEEKKELSNEYLGMSLVTKSISDDIDDYMKVRREYVTKAYKEYNHDLIDDYISDEYIVSNFGFAPYLIVKANKSQIDKISYNVNVEELSYEPTLLCEEEIYNALNVSKASVVRDNNGYTGAGVKVGILETGRYDDNYVMLNGCQNINYTYIGSNTAIKKDHATIVTSIIKGKSVQSNGRYYQGIAPDSIVYQSCVNDSSVLSDNIEHLA